MPGSHSSASNSQEKLIMLRIPYHRSQWTVRIKIAGSHQSWCDEHLKVIVECVRGTDWLIKVWQLNNLKNNNAKREQERIITKPKKGSDQLLTIWQFNKIQPLKITKLLFPTVLAHMTGFQKNVRIFWQNWWQSSWNRWIYESIVRKNSSLILNHW